MTDRHSADSFLTSAVETMQQRAKLRDAQGGERSMARTVAIFNAWTGLNLTEDDGWRFMIALKQAREKQGKFNADDYVDLAAYCGLLGEYESTNRESPKQEVEQQDSKQADLKPRVQPWPKMPQLPPSGPWPGIKPIPPHNSWPYVNIPPVYGPEIRCEASALKPSDHDQDLARYGIDSGC